jgi:hypothetical protein
VSNFVSAQSWMWNKAWGIKIKKKNLRSLFLSVSPSLEGTLLKLLCPATCKVRKASAETPHCRCTLFTPCYSLLLTGPCRGNYQPLQALRLDYILAVLTLKRYEISCACHTSGVFAPLLSLDVKLLKNVTYNNKNASSYDLLFSVLHNTR